MRVALSLLLAVGLAFSWAWMASTAHFVANFVATYFAAWGIGWGLAPRGRRRRVGFAFAAVSASLFACVIALEVPMWLGLIDYRVALRTPILDPADHPAYEVDPDLIFRRKPHLHFQGSLRGGDMSFVYRLPEADVHAYDVRYDHQGFRNAQDWTRAEVAVVGDSFVEGAYVKDSELLTSVMAQRLRTRVSNLGVVGYGAQQELVVLRRYALALDPDVVVWIFFEGNDLSNAREYAELMRDFDAAVGGVKALWSRSFAKNALQFASRLAGDPKPSALPRSGLMQRASGERERTYFLYEGAALEAADLVALELTHAALREAARLCAAANVKFVVAFAPIKYRVYAGLVDVEPDSEPAHWTLNDLPARFEAGLRVAAPSAAYLDLTLALRRAAEADALPFPRDEAHWSVAGHRAVGEALSAAIELEREARR